MDQRISENLKERTRRPVRNKRYNRSEKMCAKNILTCFEITTNMQAINSVHYVSTVCVCDANGTAVNLFFSEFEI